MDTGRMEAFSDGVLAIIITIMVLELKVPHGADLPALWPLLPVFLSYVLSFVYLGIYWNNHHHMLQVTPRVTGAQGGRRSESRAIQSRRGSGRLAASSFVWPSMALLAVTGRPRKPSAPSARMYVL